MGLSIFPIPSAAARSERTVFITSTQSWTTPADVTSVDIILVGGGGGAGGSNATNASGAGAGGGVIRDTVAVTANTAYTITIGGGGGGGSTAPDPGGDGSASTFGSLRTAFGGGCGMAGNGTNAYGAMLTTRVSSSGGLGSAGNGDYGGSGGGAGDISAPYRSNTDVFEWTRGGSVAQGVQGHRGNIYMGGNQGIDGYGAGGSGASRSNDFLMFAGFGAGNGGRPAAPQGGNGAINRGGGGGGSFGVNIGGSGGSGICIIKYWSAL